MDERLRHAPGGFLCLDHEGYILDVNDTFLNEMGYHKDDLVGQHIEYLCTPPVKMIFHSYFYPNINLYGYIKELFVKLKKQTGETMPLLMNARRYPENGSYRVDLVMLPMVRRLEYEEELRKAKQQLEGIYEEIQLKQKELTELNAQLLVLSNTDNLTGIANRKLFQEKLDQLVNQYWETGESFSLLVIDIDHFKRVNDTYGHQTGDCVLVKVAEVLRQSVPDEAVVARFGGEEFVVLLPGAAKLEAVEAARKVNRGIEQADWEEVARLTVSVGSATYTDQDDALSIVNKADRALYLSKRNGRNQVTHCDN